MKAALVRRSLAVLIVICLLPACSTSGDADYWPCQVCHFDAQDSSVLDAFLARLVDHFDSDEGRAAFLVEACAADNLFFLREVQMSSDFGDRRVEPGLLESLQEVNGLEAGYRRSDPLCFDRSMFSPDAVVARSERPGFLFSDENGLGYDYWVQLYLPGFSREQGQALVRADIGPDRHGISAVAVLLLDDSGTWVVDFFRIIEYL